MKRIFVHIVIHQIYCFINLTPKDYGRMKKVLYIIFVNDS